MTSTSSLSPDDLHRIGATIRRLREPRWKGADFADLVGISRSHLSHIEAGRRPAHLSVYRRMAELFGITLDALIGGKTKKGRAA